MAALVDWRMEASAAERLEDAERRVQMLLLKNQAPWRRGPDVTDVCRRLIHPAEERRRYAICRLHRRAMILKGLGPEDYYREVHGRAETMPPLVGADLNALLRLGYTFTSGQRPETPGLCEMVSRWVGISVAELMLPERQWQALHLGFPAMIPPGRGG